MTSNPRHGLPPRLRAHQPTRFATAQESKPSPSPGIRMTAGFKLARQCRDRDSLCESTLDRSALILCEAQGSAERFALAFCSAEASLGALDQQVTFEPRQR